MTFMSYVLLNGCNLPWDNLAQKCWNNQSKGRFSSENQNPVGLLKGENMLGSEMFSKWMVCCGDIKFILLKHVAETIFFCILLNLYIFYNNLDHDFSLHKSNWSVIKLLKSHGRQGSNYSQFVLDHKCEGILNAIPKTWSVAYPWVVLESASSIYC